MQEGVVVSINIGERAGQPLQSVEQVRAVPGHGLEGDRYYRKAGTFSDKDGPDRELTLIEIEAIETLGREAGIHLQPAEARRNVVTRGVSLNDLVDKEFQVGEVRALGIRLCEPCKHLAKLTHKGVLKGLVHRAGLRAQILSEGTIRRGDAVTS